jgi:hypothetical protein
MDIKRANNREFKARIKSLFETVSKLQKNKNQIKAEN